MVTAVFALVLKRLKRGKAPGVLLHQAHRWDLIRIPGVLPVREAGYSSVAAEGDDG